MFAKEPRRHPPRIWRWKRHASRRYSAATAVCDQPKSMFPGGPLAGGTRESGDADVMGGCVLLLAACGTGRLARREIGRTEPEPISQSDVELRERRRRTACCSACRSRSCCNRNPRTPSRWRWRHQTGKIHHSGTPTTRRRLPHSTPTCSHLDRASSRTRRHWPWSPDPKCCQHSRDPDCSHHEVVLSARGCHQ